MKIRDIEFFDREEETRDIMDVLRVKPRLITFIYGPINSGKTSLINNLIEDLPDDYVVFYINLRERMISSYRDFVETLFDYGFEEEPKKKLVKELIPDAVESIKTLSGIPIPTNIFKKIFSEEKPKNAFRYILKVIREVEKKNKIPIIIIDELQKIGDVKVNGLLIYELFNFFIRLTKELHLCHVFALSSDSLFIEKVYSDAVLEGRVRYIMVDDFDKETAKRFLKKYKFSVEEQESALNYAGGKPSHLVDLIEAKANNKIKEKIKEDITKRKGEIRQRLYYVKEIGKTIAFGEAMVKLSHEKIIEVMEKFKDNEIWEYKVVTPEIVYLVSENIIFVDPLKSIIKPQSGKDLIGIREILKEPEG